MPGERPRREILAFFGPYIFSLEAFHVPKKASLSILNRSEIILYHLQGCGVGDLNIPYPNYGDGYEGKG
jgi:hypothetical protein